MKQVRFGLLATAVVVTAVAAGWGVGEWRKFKPVPTSAPATADRGPMLYQVYCASCHGPEGHGDGASAMTMNPPPRDFASRPWRFELTPDSIRKVVREGIPGTGMVAFDTGLSEGDLNAVSDHVYRLATSNPSALRARPEDELLLIRAGFTSYGGAKPPPLTLVNAKDRTVALSDYSGQLVLLHFWGTGCTHCIKEIPSLNELEKRHPGRLKVLHICTDVEDPKTAQDALDRAAPGTEALVEANGIGLARYEVQSLPTVWLIATDGTAIGRATGAKQWNGDMIKNILEHWLPRSQ